MISGGVEVHLEEKKKMWWKMEWEEDSGIKKDFGEDCICKKMSSDETRYGNSETIERKDQN